MFQCGNQFSITDQKRYSIIEEEQLSELIINETQIKIFKSYLWFLGGIESDNKTILGIYLLVERNMFVVAEQFLRNLINEYENYPISSDGGMYMILQARKFLKIKHIIFIRIMRRKVLKNYSIYQR